jgi:hypothetical protein
MTGDFWGIGQDFLNRLAAIGLRIFTEFVMVPVVEGNIS